MLPQRMERQKNLDKKMHVKIKQRSRIILIGYSFGGCSYDMHTAECIPMVNVEEKLLYYVSKCKVLHYISPSPPRPILFSTHLLHLSHGYIKLCKMIKQRAASAHCSQTPAQEVVHQFPSTLLLRVLRPDLLRPHIHLHSILHA